LACRSYAKCSLTAATAGGRGRRQKDRSPPAGSGNFPRRFPGLAGRGAEESIFLSRDAVRKSPRRLKNEAGRKSGRPKKGRGTSDGLAFGPARPTKEQRTFGRRAQVDGGGSSHEGAVGWKATPELVSQDQGDGSFGTGSENPADPSLGASQTGRKRAGNDDPEAFRDRGANSCSTDGFGKQSA
jgi:hypothetical protein